MKKFSPAEMKEVSFPTPHTLHPLSSQEIIFIYSSPLPHFPTSPLPHFPTFPLPAPCFPSPPFPSMKSEPFLWIHLAGLAALPIFLQIAWIGLAVGDPLPFPLARMAISRSDRYYSRFLDAVDKTF